MLCGSHTHCGPCIREKDEPALALDRDYLERAISVMVECATQAWRAGPRHDFASARALAACRLAPEAGWEGRRGVEAHLDAPHDHEVPVLAVETPAGELRGLIFSYACHPTSRAGLIGPTTLASPATTWPWRFPGVTTAFIQGCGADQKPYAIDPGRVLPPA